MNQSADTCATDVSIQNTKMRGDRSQKIKILCKVILNTFHNLEVIAVLFEFPPALTPNPYPKAGEGRKKYPACPKKP